MKNKVQCKICKKYFNQITHLHLKKFHNLLVADYKRQFPNARITSLDLYNRLSKRKVWNTGLTKETSKQIRKATLKMKTTKQEYFKTHPGCRLGKHHTKEAKEKLRQVNLGKHPSEATIEKQRQNAGNQSHKPNCQCNFCQNKRNKGQHRKPHKLNCSCCFCKAKRGKTKGKNNPNYGNPSWNKGKRMSDEYRKKLSLVHGGNGILDEPTQYALSFNEALREKIRKRDNYICQNCGMMEEEHIIVYGRVLTVHHIDYDKLNSKETNLVTTCIACNTRANYNRAYWQQHYENKIVEIYNKI